MIRITLLLLLGSILCFQILRLGSTPIQLEVGERLPLELMGRGQVTPNPPEACFTAFLVDVRCPHCHALAERLAASANRDGNIIWIVLETDADAKDFGRDHGLSEATVYFAPGFTKKRGFLKRQVVVPITPLRVVLSSDLRVLEISPGQTVPTLQEMEKICS